MQRVWWLDSENPFAERPPGRLQKAAFGASAAAFAAAAWLLAFSHSGVVAIVALAAGCIGGAPVINRTLTELLLARRAARRVPLVKVELLGQVEERRIVRCRGTIRAVRPVAPAGSEVPGVWRRAEIRVRIIGGRLRETRTCVFYHDIAEDFDVEDASGDVVGIDVTSARLIARPGGRFSWAPTKLEPIFSLLSGQLQAEGCELSSIEVRSRVFRAGDPVEVVGSLTHRPDQRGTALSREVPARPVLAAGERTVVILPV